MYVTRRTKVSSVCYRGVSGKVLWEACSSEKSSVPQSTFYRFKNDWEMWECDLGLHAGNSKLRRWDPVSSGSLIWSRLPNRNLLVASDRMNLWLWENVDQIEGCSWFWSLFQDFPEFSKKEKGVICNYSYFHVSGCGGVGCLFLHFRCW